MQLPQTNYFCYMSIKKNHKRITLTYNLQPIFPRNFFYISITLFAIWKKEILTEIWCWIGLKNEQMMGIYNTGCYEMLCIFSRPYAFPIVYLFGLFLSIISVAMIKTIHFFTCSYKQMGDNVFKGALNSYVLHFLIGIKIYSN